MGANTHTLDKIVKCTYLGYEVGANTHTLDEIVKCTEFIPGSSSTPK